MIDAAQRGWPRYLSSWRGDVPIDARLRHIAATPQGQGLLQRAVASMADVSVLVFDTAMSIVEMHGGAFARHGYLPEQTVGRSAAEVLPTGSWARLRPLYARALAGESVTVDLESHDGAFVFETSFSPVYEHDQVVGGMAVSRDVTAQRRVGAAHALFETSFDAAPIGMCLVAPDGRFLRVNDALCRLLRRPADELLHCDFQSLTLPEDLDLDLALLHEMLAGTRTFYELEKRYLTPDGEVVEARLSVSLVRDANGAPTHFVSQIVDLGPLAAARRQLAAVNAQLRAILDHSPMAIYMRDLDDRWTLANAEVGRIAGIDAEGLLGQLLSATHPDQRLIFADQDRQVLESGAPCSFDLSHPVAGSDVPRHFWTLKFPMRDAEGTVTGIGGVSLDVTEREHVNRELAAAHALFESAFINAPVGMIISRVTAGDTLEVVQCNAAFAAMTGRRPEELIGRSGASLVHPDDTGERERMVAAVRAGAAASGELRLQHRDGHYVEAYVSPSTTNGPDGEPLVVVQAMDISERKRFEERLQHLADHDPRTGLINRRRFEEELESFRLKGREAALVMLDLDGFKYVNDAFGHSAGDELIVRVGDALHATLRAHDILARIGGDEFAAILPDTDLEGAQAVAATLVDAVREHGHVVSGGRHAEVTASAGLTILQPGGLQDGEALLVEADIAMYDAKLAGRDRVAVYERAGQRRDELTRYGDWVARLRRAVQDERFVLHAQPIVPLGPPTAGREHYELLLRLRDDDDQLIAPGTFLHHAERDGLIGDIDRWVLAQAVSTLHAAHAGGRDLHLAVNLSAHTMQDPDLARHLATLLAAQPIPARTLMIEVTETAAITNVARAAELARQVRDLGCLLALDDFGAGFASLSYLKHLAFDVLKIDGDFIESLPRSATDQLVVRAVVDIARGLGVSLIAERVQDDETIAVLRELGVDFGQGYHLGRPLPLPPG